MRQLVALIKYEKELCQSGKYINVMNIFNKKVGNNYDIHTNGIMKVFNYKKFYIWDGN